MMATIQKKEPLTPERAALAAAIADREVAEKNLAAARDAAAKAFDHVMQADAALERLQAEASEEQPQRVDHMIAAIDAGDLALISRPVEVLREKIAAAEQTLANWRAARLAAEAAIPDRERALEKAKEKVGRAARGVIAAGVDVQRLLADAEVAVRSICEMRALLESIKSVLPPPWADGGDVGKALDKFAWPDLTGEAGSFPVADSWLAAFEALQRDARAAIPVA
jgi:hypothetical protein